MLANCDLELLSLLFDLASLESSDQNGPGFSDQTDFDLMIRIDFTLLIRTDFIFLIGKNFGFLIITDFNLLIRTNFLFLIRINSTFVIGTHCDLLPQLYCLMRQCNLWPVVDVAQIHRDIAIIFFYLRYTLQ